MKILGISGSPRLNKMIHTTIKEILKGCNDDYQIISLTGKKINGCTSCLACASDNVCKVQDHWNDISLKMIEADIIIFGVPNYYGLPNALSHCLLERTYSYRHNSKFLLADKKAIIVTTKRLTSEIEPVSPIVETFLVSNKMNIIGKMTCEEYSTCYTCGHGESCAVGRVVALHGHLTEILPSHMPKEIHKQEITLAQIARIRQILMENGVTFG